MALSQGSALSGQVSASGDAAHGDDAPDLRLFVFTLNYAQALLVQSAFFAAYALCSIPAAIVVRRAGYMPAAAIGVLTMMVGCLLFVPASGSATFIVFLVALFVLAAGITVVQVVAKVLSDESGRGGGWLVAGGMSRKSRAKPPSPFRRFNSSPEVIRLVVLMYVRFPLSLRNVEDLLFERGYDLCHETVRLWWNRFGPLFAADIRRQRISAMRGFRHWRCWGGRPPSASMCHTEVVA